MVSHREETVTEKGCGGFNTDRFTGVARERLVKAALFHRFIDH